MANLEQWKARRFAVKFAPPCIFLEYEDSSLKKRVREVKLSRVSPDVDPDRLTRKVIRSFPRQLDAASVKYDQVRKLVTKVLEHMQQLQHSARDENGQRGGLPDKQAPSAVAGPLKPLQLRPTLTTVLSGGRATTPHTPQLVPSLSPTLPPSTSTSQSMSSMQPAARQSLDSEDRFSTSTIGGDRLSSSGCCERGPGEAQGRPHAGGAAEDKDIDLDSALNELDKEFGSGSAASGGSRPASNPGTLSNEGSYTNAGFASLGSVTSSTSVVAAAQRLVPEPTVGSLAAQSKSRFAEEADRLVLDVEVEGDVDLNKVTDVELKLAKIKMDQAFVKNQLRPGDPGFEYDKQVEFAPATELNDWDESGDEDEEQEAAPAPRAEQAADQVLPQPSLHKVNAGALSIHVQNGKHDDGNDDDGDGQGSEYSYGDQLSETSPQSVPDDVSPRRVAIDTDSSLELP